jgi:signal peptidase I
MKPTFSPNDIFIRESLSYKFFGRPIQEGDIVAFRSPSSPKHFIMKRVIAPVRSIVSLLST